MPTLFHSRLQRNLVNDINDRSDRFEAVQELRCLVPPDSPVPDIAIVACDRLPDEDGPLNGAPDLFGRRSSASLSDSAGTDG